MTESVDRTYDLLQRVGEFLKKAKPEQVEALLAGQAELRILLKTERVTRPAAPRAAKPVTLAVSSDQVAADLRTIDDRAAAARYLTDLNLGRPALVQLAKELNVHILSKSTMTQIKDLIVDQKVGHRLTSNAIAGNS